jgi:proline iminopeptidase
MWREIQPDDRIEVEVDGYKVVAYSFGSGEEVAAEVSNPDPELKH